MRGNVVDWDLDKLVEEYNAVEKLTPEEDRKLEEDLNNYMHDYAMKEMKEENENLKVKVEEMTRRADEETIKRENAEEEMKQGQEVIKSLRRNLASREVEGVVRMEEASFTSSRRSRSRVRCWDLTRPGGCQYGARCRYMHPGLEVVRAEDNQQDFPVAPAMVTGVRWAMAGGQVYRQQQPMWWINQQMNQQKNQQMNQLMKQQMRPMINQQMMMSQQMQMMMYGHQGWPASRQ